MRTIRSKILIAMGWVMLISVIVLGFFGIPTGILLCALIGLAYGGYKQDKPFRLYSSIALCLPGYFTFRILRFFLLCIHSGCFRTFFLHQFFLQKFCSVILTACQPCQDL